MQEGEKIAPYLLTANLVLHVHIVYLYADMLEVKMHTPQPSHFLQKYILQNRSRSCNSTEELYPTAFWENLHGSPCMIEYGVHVHSCSIL